MPRRQKMFEDPIVKEVREAREKILEENNYDTKKIFDKQKENIKKLQQNGWKIVNKEEILKKKSLKSINC